MTKVFNKTVKLFLLQGYILMLFLCVKSWLVSLKVCLVNKSKLDKCLNLSGIIRYLLIGERNEMCSNCLSAKSSLIG